MTAGHDTRSSPAKKEGWWRICKGSCDLHMTCWVQKNVQRDKEGNGESPKGCSSSAGERQESAGKGDRDRGGKKCLSMLEGCSEAGYCSIGETSGALGRSKEIAESFLLLARQFLMVT